MVKRLSWQNGINRWYRSIDTKLLEFKLSKWYQTKVGQELISLERAIVSQAISGRFGAVMVQVDSGYHDALFEKRLFGTGILVSQLENRALCPVVCAHPENLPFEPESVDMILMHHTFDFCENPYQSLREAAIALKPGGLMIVLGFNPFSFWGLRSFRIGSDIWHSRNIRSGRVEDWMHLLNFELELTGKHSFLPRFGRPKWLSRVSQNDSYSARVFPLTAGIYSVVGRKKVLGKIPSSAASNKRKFLEPALPARTTFRKPKS